MIAPPNWAPYSREGSSSGRGGEAEIAMLGEEFAGSEELGLAPKVLENLWGSV